MENNDLIRLNDSAELAETAKFPWAKWPFDKFNPVQSALVDVADKDYNGLIAAATSCGKTVMSEMFASHVIRNLKKKFIFLCPLRALAYEKYTDWTSSAHHFSDLNIGIYTGDFKEKDGFEENDIIIMTSEMLNHKVRIGSKFNWVNEVGVLVSDECLPPEAILQTDQGLLSIGEIIDKNLDVKVLSYNHESRTQEYKKILSRKKILNKKMWHAIYYENGNICVTQDHRVFVENKGYIYAKDIKLGDILYVNKHQYGINKKTRTNYSGVYARGWQFIFNWLQKVSKGSVQSFGKTESVCRMEVQRIEILGWNPSRRISKWGLWKDKHKTFNTFLHKVVGTLQCLLFGTKKNNYHELAGKNHGTHSLSRMVHGRRQPRQKSDGNAQSVIFRSRKSTFIRLVVEFLGSKIANLPSPKILDFAISFGRQRLFSGNNFARNNTLNEIQIDHSRGTSFLFNVWKTLSDKKKNFASNEKIIDLRVERMCKEKIQNSTENQRLGSEESFCCDLEIEDNHNFFADGVLVHNCHMLGMEGRGPHLEAALMGFSRINKNCKIILLSGTLPNVDEIASWLQKLNNKKTFIIKSDYRPCKLQIHKLMYDEDLSPRDAISEDCCKLVNRYSADKFIIFVHVKSLGNYIIEKLASRGVEARFHNANLDSKERIEIENRFKNDKSLRVLVATSTLAQGLNLPARRVIIAGVYRGTQLVPSSEILQMAGRAGRPAYDTQGDAYILFPQNDFARLSSICTTPWPVTSKMLDLGVAQEYAAFLFHILAEIYEGRIKSIDDIEKYYQESLSDFQKIKLRMSILLESIQKYARQGILKFNDTNGALDITGLGKISVVFYANPLVVASYARNFTEMFQKTDFNDLHICLSLANNQENLVSTLSKEDKQNMQNFLERVKQVTHTTYPEGVLKQAYIYYRVLHGHFDAKYASVAKQFQQDFPRTTAVLQAVDSWVKKWDRKDFFQILEKRIKYGVSSRLVSLVEIKNIGKLRAEKLYNAGFKSRADILANLNGAAKAAGVNAQTLKANTEYNS